VRCPSQLHTYARELLECVLELGHTGDHDNGAGSSWRPFPINDDRTCSHQRHRVEHGERFGFAYVAKHDHFIWEICPDREG
jgi:hypothetical protein